MATLSFHLKFIVTRSVLSPDAVGNTTLGDGANPIIDDGSRLVWCGITGARLK